MLFLEALAKKQLLQNASRLFYDGCLMGGALQTQYLHISCYISLRSCVESLQCVILECYLHHVHSLSLCKLLCLLKKLPYVGSCHRRGGGFFCGSLSQNSFEAAIYLFCIVSVLFAGQYILVVARIRRAT